MRARYIGFRSRPTPDEILWSMINLGFEEDTGDLRHCPFSRVYSLQEKSKITDGKDMTMAFFYREDALDQDKEHFGLDSVSIVSYGELVSYVADNEQQFDGVALAMRDALGVLVVSEKPGKEAV